MNNIQGGIDIEENKYGDLKGRNMYIGKKLYNELRLITSKTLFFVNKNDGEKRIEFKESYKYNQD